MFGISLSVRVLNTCSSFPRLWMNSKKRWVVYRYLPMSSGKWWPLLIMVEPERNRSLPVIYKWPLIQTFILLKAFNGFFQGQPQLSYSSWLLTLHFLGLHTGGETLPFWWLSICIFRHLWDVILMCLAKISVLSLSQIWNIFFSRIGKFLPTCRNSAQLLSICKIKVLFSKENLL